MAENDITTYKSSTYTPSLHKSFKQFFIICKDTVSICTDLHYNLKMFKDLPVTPALPQPVDITTTYADSTCIKATHRGLNIPERSLKSRRKSLVYKGFILKIVAAVGVKGEKYAPRRIAL